MVTQHPDHAHTPYWHYRPFISTQEETQELFLSFQDLGASEYKWDWEGKLVDEAILERLFSQYYDYFQHTHIGKDKFLTFRLPNPKVETEYRLGRAFMGILAASGLAKSLGLKNNPLFEVILPMTESAHEIFSIQEAFREMASIKHPLLKRGEEDIEHIEMIPLFEDIDTIMNSDAILEEYVRMHIHGFDGTPEYIRPYLARSDPALNAGIVPTVLAIKIALSRYAKLSQRLEIPLYPMIGAAALPFRGGISPRTIESFIDEYRGIKTTTIQSAFRYDYPKEEVLEALQQLERELPVSKPRIISDAEEQEMREIIEIFRKPYQETIEHIAPYINTIAAFVPKRRERVQHVGLFGYSRGVGTVKLPRAITFTASLYSIGIPPELIGTGRGIRALKVHKNQKLLACLKKQYRYIRSNLTHALNYTTISNVEELAKQNIGFQMILDDVRMIQEFLQQEGAEFSPEHEHQSLTEDIVARVSRHEDISKQVERAAFLRRSIG